MILNLDTLGRFFAGFDNWCDDIGGMEDIDFCFRVIALAGFSVKMVPLQIPLIVGRHYDQATKEANERKAMDAIIARWRGYFPKGAPERDRIDLVIGQMQLEA